MRSFDGKAVFVTGGSRGIGLEIARALAARGARVYGCSRSGSADLGVSYICDITQESEVATMFADVRMREPKGLSLVIHNAAILEPRSRLVDIESAAWNRVVDVNLNGAFLVAKHSLSLMAPDGTWVGISSSVGRKGRAEWGAYSASKHGLEGLLDIIAGEYPALTVLSINPGGTATDMRAQAFPEEDAATLPTAEDVAQVVIAQCESQSPVAVARLNVRDFLG